jgi:hypothetical protein
MFSWSPRGDMNSTPRDGLGQQRSSKLYHPPHKHVRMHVQHFSSFELRTFQRTCPAHRAARGKTQDIAR